MLRLHRYNAPVNLGPGSWALDLETESQFIWSNKVYFNVVNGNPKLKSLIQGCIQTHADQKRHLLVRVVLVLDTDLLKTDRQWRIQGVEGFKPPCFFCLSVWKFLWTCLFNDPDPHPAFEEFLDPPLGRDRQCETWSEGLGCLSIVVGLWVLAVVVRIKQVHNVTLSIDVIGCAVIAQILWRSHLEISAECIHLNRPLIPHQWEGSATRHPTRSITRANGKPTFISVHITSVLISRFP